MQTLKTLPIIGLLCWFGQFYIRLAYQLHSNSTPFLKQLVLQQVLGEEPQKTNEEYPSLEDIKRLFNTGQAHRCLDCPGAILGDLHSNQT